MAQTPTIYIDTNICRDCIKGRGLSSINLMNTIRDNKWNCITSVFTFMELIDIEKDDLFFHKKNRLGWEVNKIIRERYHKDLGIDDFKEISQHVRAFYNTYNFIEILTLGKEGWSQAFSTSMYSNLSESDIIHLEIAWESGADVLVTSDEDFIRHGTKLLKEEKMENQLKICRPTDVIGVLQLMKIISKKK